MKKIDIEFLSGVIKAETSVLLGFIPEFLKDVGYDVKTDGTNYVVGIPKKGEISNVCLVSHLDTVHRSKVKLDVTQFTITNESSAPLGADDRAGVATILNIIHQNKNKKNAIRPIVVFTNFEETGGKGVAKMILDFILDEYIQDISLFIELDRKGSSEFVAYSNKVPKHIKELMNYYGFFEGFGSYSDVKNLTDAYSIPHVNLSIGYYEQHSAKEYLVIASLNDVMERVELLIQEKIERITMTDDEIFRTSTYNSSNKYGQYDWATKTWKVNKEYSDKKVNKGDKETTVYLPPTKEEKEKAEQKELKKMQAATKRFKDGTKFFRNFKGMKLERIAT